MVLEKALIKDIDEIMNIYVERVEWFKEKNINQWRNYLSNHPRSQFVKSINDGKYYVLKDNNKIVGGFEISDHSLCWKENSKDAYYLNKLVTKVGTKGIGSEIFNIAKDMTTSNNKKYLRVECIATNKKLNAIYEKNGFEYVKEGFDYYHYVLRQWKNK